MLGVERRHVILEMLQEVGSVVVTELAQQFAVSDETIRRDLSRMEEEGLLQKTYGGAFIQKGMHRVVRVGLREHTCVEGKNVIGTLAAELIEPGDTIFLDASSTSLFIASHILEKKNLVVITNALRVAETLALANSMKVICVGGTLRSATLTLVGRAAEAGIGNYFADKAFISCDGLHQERGITDSDEREAEVRKQMIRQAESAILVVDATKFDRTSFVHVASFDQFDTLITDRLPHSDWFTTLESNNVACIHGSPRQDTIFLLPEESQNG